jgi:hypothetical protein
MRERSEAGNMKKEMLEQIEDIICRMKCSKDFVCYRSGFRGLCMAEDIGLESFVACMSKESQHCEFAINFGGRFFCKCPLRICISKNLENKN